MGKQKGIHVKPARSKYYCNITRYNATVVGYDLSKHYYR